MFDVSIVGLGPSGAVAAALLGQAGLRVFVCDRDAGVYDKPRAASLDHEVMRLFQQLGIAAQVAPFVEPFTDSCFYGVQGQLIRRMTMLAHPYPQAWTPSMVFTQPEVERVLRQAVAALPGVSVELGCEATAVTQDAEGVSLHLADGRSLRSRYLIACDGASSTLRRWANLELDDLQFDQRWLVVDALVNAAAAARLPATSVQYCEPKRPCTYLILPGSHRRWEISLNVEDDDQRSVTPEGTWALLQRWITPADGQLWRQASYRFHALVARQWRAGRLFLAGDAAHQQPPFLGQGMCQGLRDVANLCWKLKAVMQGQAGDGLLDSYGPERGGHVRELTQRLTHIGQLIGERDLARAHERDARLLREAGGTVQPTPRQDVLPRLACGVLAAKDHPARGGLFPQPWLLTEQGSQQRMDDVLGHGWRLISTATLALADQALSALPGLRCLALTEQPEAEGVLQAWFERHACCAALLRPDHYVFGIASNPAQAHALLLEAGIAMHAHSALASPIAQEIAR